MFNNWNIIVSNNLISNLIIKLEYYLFVGIIIYLKAVFFYFRIQEREYCDFCKIVLNHLFD